MIFFPVIIIYYISGSFVSIPLVLCFGKRQLKPLQSQVFPFVSVMVVLCMLYILHV